MLGLFQVPRFPLVFAATVSMLVGESLMIIFFSLWMRILTGSDSNAALTFFFLALPALVLPLVGVVIERLSRRRTLTWGNLLTAASLLPLLLVRDASAAWIIWVVAFVYGFSMMLLPATLNGILKEALPQDQLAHANGAIQSTKQVLRLVGPPVGTGIYMLSGEPAWVVTLCVIALVLAALLFKLLPLDRPSRPDNEGPMRELRAAFAFLRVSKDLRTGIAGASMLTAALGFYEASIYAMLTGMDLRPEAVSVLVAIQGVGAVLSGLLAGRIIGAIGEIRALIYAMVCLGVALGTVAATGQPVVAGGSSFIIGASVTLVVVCLITVMQKTAPQDIVVRVSTLVEMITTAPRILSLLFGAAIVASVRWEYTYGAIAIAIAGTAAVMHIRPASRKTAGMNATDDT